MEKLRVKARRLKNYLKNDFLTFEKIITVFSFLLCISFAMNAINAIAKNWQLKQKLQDKVYEVERMRLEVDKLSLERQYYQTDEYKELLARSKGGKMAEGEVMLVLPANSAEAKSRHKDNSTPVKKQKTNFEQWLDLLF